MLIAVHQNVISFGLTGEWNAQEFRLKAIKSWVLSMSKAVDILWMGRQKCGFEENYLIFSFANKRENKYFYKIQSTDSQRLILSLLSLWDMVRNAGLHFWVPRLGIFLRGITQFVSGGNPYQETFTWKSRFWNFCPMAYPKNIASSDRLNLWSHTMGAHSDIGFGHY